MSDSHVGAQPAVIRLHPHDNVVVARRALAAGEAAQEGSPTRAPIPAGHKVATRRIAKGEPIRKYDQIIGFATADILPGDHVHTQNVEVRDFGREHAIGADARPTAMIPEHQRATFMGYRRADGRAATRNYVGVLTSVNCSARVAKLVAEAFRGDALADFPNVDGVVALTHGSGCASASSGEAYELLQRTIAGYARHPNFAAALVIGLGCETNQVSELMREHGMAGDPRVVPMVIQEKGGTTASVREGIARVRELLPQANRVAREALPASELVLGLNCGGSDAYSGISANPALGAAVDLLVRHGGSAALAETPEIYGAEHLLTRRAASPRVAEKLLERIAWWIDYAQRNHAEMNNNPSHGNKVGGLTTILEKSLGATAKGGTTNLVDVYRYAEAMTAKGFVFMDTPGFDPVSVTGLVAGGANVVCFTTGRGSLFGCKPAPSIKLATNTPMYQRMSEDMDLDCGVVLDGEATVQQMGERIFARILATASGQRTKSELLGFGDDEFVPWVVGAVM